jgi:C1A family cysteine protease
VLPQSGDSVDVKGLTEEYEKNKDKCGMREMAPGIWVRLECEPFQKIGGIGDAFSPAKLKMLRQGKLHTTRGRHAPSPNETETLPDTVDHRVDGIEGPVKSQGAVGACTAFSLSTVMDNAILRIEKETDAGLDNDEKGRWSMSPLHIWSHYATPNMKVAGEATLHKVIASLEVWPYSPRQACEIEKDTRGACGQAYRVHAGSGAHDPAIQRAKEKADHEGQYRIAAIEHISTKPVDVDAIAAVLASGADVWIGIGVDSHAWAHLKAENPVVPDWHSTEGGHAVALAGYRKGPNGKRQFLVHNSWGGTWGDHGFGWINEEMIQRHVEYAYSVRVQDKDGKAGPQTDQGCGENELIDSDTGLCAAMCPGQTRRVNGQCDGGGGGGKRKHEHG